MTFREILSFSFLEWDDKIDCDSDWPWVLMWSLSSLSVCKTFGAVRTLEPLTYSPNSKYVKLQNLISCKILLLVNRAWFWHFFLPSMALCRMMWSNNLVLLAYIPPQPGHATTFSWVWLRRCSRILGRPFAVASQSEERQVQNLYSTISDA